MKYQTKGTCSTSIDVEVEDGKIKFVQFFGGCNGNLKGIASLVTGMEIEDAISRLKGIRCGFKPTSCPDQLAHALEQIKEGNC
ncbi:MAG: TIGR03905 family TSCPD domain-containing protein [Lachnospiraceae bacterium]|jgi:uncharacterized protein (TIGR03905 family)|nr:TIGR03905 family TSCPD domain-containing protein [Lachnospiraceae bacterium]